MIIKNITKNTIIATEAKLADNFLARLKGLLGTELLEKGSALIITSCNGIHTVGMKYSIDIIFVDKNNKVIKIVTNMPSMKFTLCRRASYVIETSSDVVDTTSTKIGDIIAVF